MNKKLIALIIAIVIIAIGGISLIFSNSDIKTEPNNNNSNNSTNTNTNINNNNQENNNTPNADDKQTSSSKIAIIYFSATGTTKKVAEHIKDTTQGELIEIIPKDKYTDEDLNYNNNNCRANKEQNDSSSRPEIANTINTDNYDVIYLGYPIWWGDAPRIILTFLDSHNLSNKTVIPFCTSGGSSISTSISYFKNHYQNIKWLDGKNLSTSKSEVTNWINGLNY